MSILSWQQRTTPAPTLEELNTKIEARLRFLEGELKKQGIHFICGAELEFFILNKFGNPWLGEIDCESCKSELKKHLGNNAAVERMYEEDKFAGLYEVVLGTSKNDLSFPYHSAEIAKQAEVCRKMMPEIFSGYGKNIHVSFASISGDDHSKTTAGLHYNFSARDDAGHNLFCDKDRMEFSTLAHNTALNLLALQKDGLPLYAPTPQSYERFHTYEAPTAFGIKEIKGNSSVALRKTNGLAKSCRVEDRLGGADMNVYFATLAAVGALWRANTHKSGPVEKWTDTTLPCSPSSQSLTKFEGSYLWKEIAGEELHADLVAYCKAQAQAHTRQANHL